MDMDRAKVHGRLGTECQFLSDQQYNTLPKLRVQTDLDTHHSSLFPHMSIYTHDHVLYKKNLKQVCRLHELKKKQTSRLRGNVGSTVFSFLVSYGEPFISTTSEGYELVSLTCQGTTGGRDELIVLAMQPWFGPRLGCFSCQGSTVSPRTNKLACRIVIP